MKFLEATSVGRERQWVGNSGLGFFKLENSLFISLTVIREAKSFDGG